MRWTDEQLLDALAYLGEHGLVERVQLPNGEEGYRPTERAQALSDRHPEWGASEIAVALREAIDDTKEAQ